MKKFIPLSKLERTTVSKEEISDGFLYKLSYPGQIPEGFTKDNIKILESIFVTGDFPSTGFDSSGVFVKNTKNGATYNVFASEDFFQEETLLKNFVSSGEDKIYVDNFKNYTNYTVEAYSDFRDVPILIEEKESESFDIYFYSKSDLGSIKISTIPEFGNIEVKNAEYIFKSGAMSTQESLFANQYETDNWYRLDRRIDYLKIPQDDQWNFEIASNNMTLGYDSTTNQLLLKSLVIQSGKTYNVSFDYYMGGQFGWHPNNYNFAWFLYFGNNYASVNYLNSQTLTPKIPRSVYQTSSYNFSFTAQENGFIGFHSNEAYASYGPLYLKNVVVEEEGGDILFDSRLDLSELISGADLNGIYKYGNSGQISPYPFWTKSENENLYEIKYQQTTGNLKLVIQKNNEAIYMSNPLTGVVRPWENEGLYLSPKTISGFHGIDDYSGAMEIINLNQPNIIKSINNEPFPWSEREVFEFGSTGSPVNYTIPKGTGYEDFYIGNLSDNKEYILRGNWVENNFLIGDVASNEVNLQNSIVSGWSGVISGTQEVTETRTTLRLNEASGNLPAGVYLKLKPHIEQFGQIEYQMLAISGPPLVATPTGQPFTAADKNTFYNPVDGFSYLQIIDGNDPNNYPLPTIFISNHLLPKFRAGLNHFSPHSVVFNILGTDPYSEINAFAGVYRSSEPIYITGALDEYEVNGVYTKYIKYTNPEITLQPVIDFNENSPNIYRFSWALYSGSNIIFREKTQYRVGVLPDDLKNPCINQLIYLPEYYAGNQEWDLASGYFNPDRVEHITDEIYHSKFLKKGIAYSGNFDITNINGNIELYGEAQNGNPSLEAVFSQTGNYSFLFRKYSNSRLSSIFFDMGPDDFLEYENLKIEPYNESNFATGVQIRLVNGDGGERLYDKPYQFGSYGQPPSLFQRFESILTGETNSLFLRVPKNEFFDGNIGIQGLAASSTTEKAQVKKVKENQFTFNTKSGVRYTIYSDLTPPRESGFFKIFKLDENDNPTEITGCSFGRYYTYPGWENGVTWPRPDGLWQSQITLYSRHDGKNIIRYSEVEMEDPFGFDVNITDPEDTQVIVNYSRSVKTTPLLETSVGYVYVLKYPEDLNETFYRSEQLKVNYGFFEYPLYIKKEAGQQGYEAYFYSQTPLTEVTVSLSDNPRRMEVVDGTQTSEIVTVFERQNIEFFNPATTFDTTNLYSPKMDLNAYELSIPDGKAGIEYTVYGFRLGDPQTQWFVIKTITPETDGKIIVTSSVQPWGWVEVSPYKDYSTFAFSFVDYRPPALMKHVIDTDLPLINGNTYNINGQWSSSTYTQPDNRLEILLNGSRVDYYEFNGDPVNINTDFVSQGDDLIEFSFPRQYQLETKSTFNQLKISGLVEYGQEEAVLYPANQEGVKMFNAISGRVYSIDSSYNAGTIMEIPPNLILGTSKIISYKEDENVFFKANSNSANLAISKDFEQSVSVIQ